MNIPQLPSELAGVFLFLKAIVICAVSTGLFLVPVVVIAHECCEGRAR
jgi:hypothetical protein